MSSTATLDKTLRDRFGPDARRLPVGTVGGYRSSGWFGMLFLILTEASIFGYLVFGYFYTAAFATGAWPPQGPPRLAYALPNLLLALVSAATMGWAERSLHRGRLTPVALGLALTLVIGLAFAGLQLLDWRAQAGLVPGAYASLYFTITGIHFAHLLVGLCVLGALLAWTLRGYISPTRAAPVLIGAAYWYFVVAAEIAVFATLSLSPYLG